MSEHRSTPLTPAEQAEFDAWERLGDEAWAMIDEWERESGAPDPAARLVAPKGRPAIARGDNPGFPGANES